MAANTSRPSRSIACQTPCPAWRPLLSLSSDGEPTRTLSRVPNRSRAFSAISPAAASTADTLSRDVTKARSTSLPRAIAPRAALPKIRASFTGSRRALSSPATRESRSNFNLGSNSKSWPKAPTRAWCRLTLYRSVRGSRCTSANPCSERSASTWFARGCETPARRAKSRPLLPIPDGSPNRARRSLTWLAEAKMSSNG